MNAILAYLDRKMFLKKYTVFCQEFQVVKNNLNCEADFFEHAVNNLNTVF